MVKALLLFSVYNDSKKAVSFSKTDDISKSSQFFLELESLDTYRLDTNVFFTLRRISFILLSLIPVSLKMKVFRQVISLSRSTKSVR